MSAVSTQAVAAADAYCAALVRHYENFTVASRLTPRPLRRDLMRVYAFCRTTDDLGDAGVDPNIAVHRLTRWRADVAAVFDDAAPTATSSPALLALRATVRRHRLGAQPFLDLVDANLQDQRVRAYEDWPALLGYCALSAAPVGRIVLSLFGIDSPQAVALSDDVCIGLQLANFAQDVSVDARLGRTYLLQRDLREQGDAGAVRTMCDRARTLLASGRELESLVSGRLRLQLALYRLGGEAILDAIEKDNYTTHRHRPVVERAERARILINAMSGGWRRRGAPLLRNRGSSSAAAPATTGPASGTIDA